MSLSNNSIIFLSFLFSFFLFPSLSSSHDISKLLSQYPSFSSFSNYLTQTQLSTDINNRQTITVLAVDNAGISSLSGKSMDVIKKVLSIHVILDYYDVNKFQNLNNGSATLTTLFQASGQATGQLGFLNVANTQNGAVSFTSAADQSSGGAATLVKSVASEPYNLSVVQISTVIVPSGLTAATSPQSSSSAPSHNSPASSPPAPVATSPAGSPKKSPAPAPPKKSPVAAAPGPVESVSEGTPAASPVTSPAGSPVGAAPSDGGGEETGAATVFGVNIKALVTVVSLLWGMILQ